MHSRNVNAYRSDQLSKLIAEVLNPGVIVIYFKGYCDSLYSEEKQAPPPSVNQVAPQFASGQQQQPFIQYGQAPMAVQHPNVQYIVKIVNTCKYLAVSEVSRGPHTNLYAKGPR